MKTTAVQKSSRVDNMIAPRYKNVGMAFMMAMSSTFVVTATKSAFVTSPTLSTLGRNEISHSPSFRSRSFLAYTNGTHGFPKSIKRRSSPPVSLKRSNVSNQHLPPSSLPNGGHITLVGAGPGDPDLLTIAAYKILSDPDALIVSDRLVSAEILELIQGECKVARKMPGCAELAQEEIYKWCKEGLDAGKHVVRLKIGDPFVFGRGGEEVLKFREHGVEPKVIPGVSAAFSAPLLGSIPVTHRGVSNQVVMCTGYGRDGTSPDLIQYHKEQTIVFLMAVGRLRQLCERLIRLAGYPSTTAVAIIESAGCPNQRIVVGNMETIADLAEEYEVKPPSTIIIGEVVNVLLKEDDSAIKQILDTAQTA